MKRKFDFTIYDDKCLYRDVIRFYPRSSHVHSFNDDPPTNWEKVYKVYYSWVIIRQYYKSNDQNSIQPRSTKKLFDMSMDECSMLPDLSTIIKDIVNTGKTFDYPTMGQPAGDWKIERKIFINLRYSTIGRIKDLDSGLRKTKFHNFVIG